MVTGMQRAGYALRRQGFQNRMKRDGELLEQISAPVNNDGVVNL